MNTWRETLLSTVAATLAGVAGGRVYRTRAEALSRDELPAVVVKPGGERVDSLGRGAVMRHLTVLIEIHARGTPADSIADPVAAAVHAALMADDTLGGRVRRLIEQGMAVQFADGDDTAVQLTLTYQAAYATTTHDITQPI